MTDNSMKATTAGPTVEHRNGRRQLLGTTFAMATGLGLQSLLANQAVADQRAGHAVTLTRSPELLMGSMQEAIQACLDCHSMCLRMAMTYCAAQGGKHVAAAHLQLMINCAEICQTCANFMLSDSPLHKTVAAACAEVCEACAKSCEQVGGMQSCIDECRKCEKSCKAMI